MAISVICCNTNWLNSTTWKEFTLRNSVWFVFYVTSVLWPVARGEKLAKDVEDSERQNDAHILVTRLPRTQNKHKLACNNLYTETLLYKLNALTNSFTMISYAYRTILIESSNYLKPFEQLSSDILMLLNILKKIRFIIPQRHRHFQCTSLT